MLREKIKWILGKDISTNLERKLILINCLVIILFAGSSIFINTFLSLDDLTIWLCYISIGIGIAFYLITRFYSGYQKLLPLFFLNINLVLFFLFIHNGGFDGPIPIITFLYTLVFITTSPIKWHKWIIFLQILIYSSFFIIEFEFSEIIIRYISRKQELQDSLFSYFFILLHAFFSFSSIISYYQNLYKNSKFREKELQLASLSIIQKNEDLHKSNFLKNKIFGIISTDLRTPFNSLKAITYLLKNNNLSDNENQILFKELHKEVDLTSSLMDNLLLWGNSQTDKFSIKKDSIRITDLVNSIINYYKDITDLNKIIIQNNVPKEYYLLEDISILKLVLKNILAFSIKNSPKNEMIMVNSSKIGDIITISIIDKGYENTIKDSTLLIHNLDNRNGLPLWFSKQFLPLLGSELEITQLDNLEGTIISFKMNAALSIN